jgi:Predicted AAA-ATPase
MKYWLTGVLPAFRDGISPLTAVNIISDKPKYHGLCGLTEVEVEAITKAYLGPESTAEDISKALHTLRRWYNGYRFSPPLSEGLNSLYNPQLVFTHLRHLQDDKKDKHGFEPKDEIEAIHTATVIPNDGNLSFKNTFLRVASGSLSPEVRHQISAREFHQRDSNPWLTQTLLYFFGVFTHDKNMKCLTLPNMTMKTLVRVIVDLNSKCPNYSLR